MKKWTKHLLLISIFYFYLISQQTNLKSFSSLKRSFSSNVYHILAFLKVINCQCQGWIQNLLGAPFMTIQTCLNLVCTVCVLHIVSLDYSVMTEMFTWLGWCRRNHVECRTGGKLLARASCVGLWLVLSTTAVSTGTSTPSLPTMYSWIWDVFCRAPVK